MTVHHHEKLDYVEFPARDLPATKGFFEKVFGWTFTDYGPAYTAFAGQGLDGGFYQAEMASSPAAGAALLVFYSDRLEETLAKVEAGGGVIVKPIFAFPGGRRFHFTEPSGNEFAVWSTPEEQAG
ncbi:VOC family protein [Hydrogenophaga sp. 5NK40-0174]|uniref:VOC family protein n=1 Tax=Hydrogenophaga sp. 5NK40-0174 TaxID=3127649 RepID=UPI0031053528